MARFRRGGRRSFGRKSFRGGRRRMAKRGRKFRGARSPKLRIGFRM